MAAGEDRVHVILTQGRRKLRSAIAGTPGGYLSFDRVYFPKVGSSRTLGETWLEKVHGKEM